MKTVFVDSSVIFTAVNSPSGGSSKLFTIKNIRLITSRLVLIEVERNVRKKLLDYHLERFFLLASKLHIVELPIDRSLISEAEKAIVKKDAAILAQAKQSGAKYLVTLDKKHFFHEKPAAFIKPAKIATPKELLT